MSATPVQVVPNSFKPLPAPSAPPSGGSPAVEVVAGSFKPLNATTPPASNDVAKPEPAAQAPHPVQSVVDTGSRIAAQLQGRMGGAAPLDPMTAQMAAAPTLQSQQPTLPTADELGHRIFGTPPAAETTTLANQALAREHAADISYAPGARPVPQTIGQEVQQATTPNPIQPVAAAPPTVTPLSSVRETAAAVPVKYPVGTGQATSDPDTLAAYKEQQTAAHDVAAAKTSDAYDQWADKNIPRLIPDPDNSQDVSRIQDLQSSIDSGKRNLQQAPLTKDEENLFLRTALSGTRPDDVRDHPIAAAVAHSVQKNLSQLSRVDQLALMAAMPEEGILGMITKLAFGGQMAAGVIQQVPAAMQAYKEGDHAKAAGLATDVLINSAFLAMMAKHEVSSQRASGAPVIDPYAVDNYRREQAATRASDAANATEPRVVEPAANTTEHPPIGATEPETGRPILQQSPRTEVNQAAATAEHPAVKDAIADAIKPITGAKITGARDEKAPERLDEKMADEDQSPRTVRDYSGYRIAVDSPAARDQTVAALKQNFEVLSEQDNFEKGDEEHGFHSHTLNVREPGSPVSHEVQILPREVAETANDNHDLYEKARDGDKDAAAALQAKNTADWEKYQTRQTSVDTPSSQVSELNRGNEGGRGESPEQPVAAGTPAAAEPTEGGERRGDTGQRQRIDQMTPDEMRQTLLTSEKTGLPNRRAFDEAQHAQPSAAVAMSDADGLKALNDRFGYAAGDALLQAKADALREAGVDAYHDKGDEFLYRGGSPEELKAKLDQAREILRNRVIEVEMTDGSIHRFKGADFSYGTGTETTEAERALKQHKSEREASGERARGELQGIARVGPEEGKEHLGGAEVRSATSDQGGLRAPVPPGASRAEGSAAGTRAEVPGRPELAAPRPPKPPPEKAAFTGGGQSTPIEVRDAEGNWQHGTLDYYNDGVNGTPRRGRVTLDNGFKMNNVADADMRAATEKAASSFKQSGQKKADIGIDFDGTLATDTGTSELGKPLAERLASVKQMLADGKTVEIITRRVENDPTGAEAKKIQDWLEANGLPRLPVTDQKTAGVLYDDNAYHAPTDANTPLPTEGRTPDVKPGEGGRNPTEPTGEQAPHPDIAREQRENEARAVERNANLEEAGNRSLRENVAAQKSRVETTDGRKALVLDTDGETAWHRLFKKVADLGAGESWRGMTLDKAGVDRAAAYLKVQAADAKSGLAPDVGAAAGYQRMAAALEAARGEDGGVSVLRGDYRADTGREEATHQWQREHGLDRSQAMAEVAAEPDMVEIARQLRDMGYEDLMPQDMAAELMAKALAGDEDFHLTDEQRETMVRSFLTAAVEEKGPEILRNLPSTDPRLTNVIKEVKRGYDYGEQYDQRNEGGRGSAARGGDGQAGGGVREADEGARPGDRGKTGRGPDKGGERGVREERQAEGKLRAPKPPSKLDDDEPYFQRKAPRPPPSMALPGMEDAATERARVAGEDQGRELTERLRAPIKHATDNRGTFDATNPSILFQRAGPTDSEPFKKWFGDSKAVDEDDTPRVVYHGTALNFDKFDPKQTGSRTNGYDVGDFGEAVYFADNPETANKYAASSALGWQSEYKGPEATREQIQKVADNREDNAALQMSALNVAKHMEYGKPFAEAMKQGASQALAERLGGTMERVGPELRQTLMPVYLKAEHPLVLNSAKDVGKLYELGRGEEKWFSLSPAEQAAAIRAGGYDSVHDTSYGQWAVFDPTQVKSAIGNRGTFDPDNPSILFQRTAAPEEDRLGLGQTREEWLAHDNEQLDAMDALLEQMTKGEEDESTRRLIESADSLVESFGREAPRNSTEERLMKKAQEIRKQSLKEEENKRGKDGLKWLQAQNAEADARRRNANGKTEGPLQKTPSALSRLNERIAEKPKAPVPLKDKLLAQTQASGRAAVKDAGNVLKMARGAMEEAWQGLRDMRKPPSDVPPEERPTSGYMQAYGRYEEAQYRSARDHEKIAAALKERVPDPLSQEAMTNWIQARGDNAKLKFWADNSKAPYKAGYERAMKLTPDEKSIAEDFKRYYDEQEREAKYAGLLGKGKSDYMMQIHEADTGQGGKSLIDTTKLNDNPSIFKPSTYRNYFEAESAGQVPVNKQIGWLTGRYDELMGEAVRTRAMLGDALNTREKDGRPSLILRRDGMLMQIGPENEPYIMHYDHADDGSDPDRRDYEMVPHPTMRRWLWESRKDLGLDDLTKKQLEQFESADGVAMRGDIYAHPDVVKHLSNMLGKSAIRATAFGRVPLAVSQFAKDLMFTFAGTHEMITSTTALMEGQPPINLDNLKKIATLKGWANPLDMDDKILDIDHGPDAKIKALGVRNGLTLLNISHEEGWSEGGMMSGAMKYLGPPGRLMVDYKNFLFRNVMPKIKMKMFVERYKVDAERYGKTKTPDEIAENTARQVNSLVGGINWQRMGVSKTAVDLARLTLLAPDFQYGAVSSAAQALKPGGRQQMMVFARSALIMYGTARIINAIANDGDAKWDKQDAFRLVVNGKHYGIRTRVGDAVELAQDPALYIAHRLNPVFSRTALEAVTRKDEYGRAKNALGIAEDAVTNTVPITIAPLLKNQDMDWQQTFMNSFGIQSGKYYSPTETMAHRLRIGHIPQGGADAEEDEATAEMSREHRHVKEKLRDGSMSTAELWNEVKAGKLTAADARRIHRAALMTPLQEDTQALPLNEAMKVYAKANTAERAQLHTLILAKAERTFERRPEEAKVMAPKVRELMAEK